MDIAIKITYEELMHPKPAPRNYVEICTRPSETLPFQTAFQTVSNNLSGLIVPVVPIAPVSFLGTEMAVPLVTSVVVPVVVIT